VRGAGRGIEGGDVVASYDPKEDKRRGTGYAIAVAAIGWLSLLMLVLRTYPVRLPAAQGAPPARNLLAVGAFYVALFVAVSATLLPPAAYLNVRFGRFDSRQVFRRRYLRQSMFGGLFVVLVAWMQMQHMLTWTLGLVLLAVFVLTETFLITREMPKER
jgi:hypothetical protein